MIRVGQGFDFHAWGSEPANFITLGGIRIPYHRSINAHSDGDLVLHALCDALLGAIGLGDIGEHFPDSDASYKGASSTVFLTRVLGLLREQAWRIGNIDITLVAESPKLSPYRPVMRTHIADLLGVEESQLNVKATTMESRGCIGREEGIAAMVVVLIEN